MSSLLPPTRSSPSDLPALFSSGPRALGVLEQSPWVNKSTPVKVYANKGGVRFNVFVVFDRLGAETRGVARLSPTTRFPHVCCGRVDVQT
jgi:hypothetical protein